MSTSLIIFTEKKQTAALKITRCPSKREPLLESISGSFGWGLLSKH